jgi:hypothetical protein
MTLAVPPQRLVDVKILVSLEVPSIAPLGKHLIGRPAIELMRQRYASPAGREEALYSPVLGLRASEKNNCATLQCKFIFAQSFK